MKPFSHLLGPRSAGRGRSSGGGSAPGGRTRRSRGSDAFVGLDTLVGVDVVLVVDELIGVNTGRGRGDYGHRVLGLGRLDRHQAQAVVLVDGQVVAPLALDQQLVERVRDEVRVRHVHRALGRHLERTNWNVNVNGGASFCELSESKEPSIFSSLHPKPVRSSQNGRLSFEVILTKGNNLSRSIKLPFLKSSRSTNGVQ